MIATTGAQLLPPSTLHLLQTHLLPLATIVTPNVPEALRLLESTTAGVEHSSVPREVRTADDLEAIARAIRALGSRWVLVKGGHCPFGKDGVAVEEEEGRERVVDVLVGEEGGEEVVVRMETGYCRTRHTHGTGCSLACEFFLPFSFYFVCFHTLCFSLESMGSGMGMALTWLAAAIASNLAKGMEMPASVKAACRYVQAGIRTAPGLGGGNGPLNHFHSVYSLPFSPYGVPPASSLILMFWLIYLLVATLSTTSWSGLMSPLSGRSSSATRLCWPWATERCPWSRSRGI